MLALSPFASASPDAQVALQQSLTLQGDINKLIENVVKIKAEA